MPALTDVVKVLRWQEETAVWVSLSDLGQRLTPDGEMALLGFSHYYLATWIARVEGGHASRPRRWPVVAYEYVPGLYMTLPILDVDAIGVMQSLAGILGRAGSLEPMPRARACGPRGRQEAPPDSAELLDDR